MVAITNGLINYNRYILKFSYAYRLHFFAFNLLYNKYYDDSHFKVPIK